MTSFERLVLILLCITLLVVSVANAVTNWIQNTTIGELTRKLEVLDADMDTRCGRLELGFSSYQKEQSEVHELMINTFRDMVLGTASKEEGENNG